MKITYGDTEFDFKFLFWFAILFVLFTDPMFLELISGKIDKNNPTGAMNPEKFLAPFSLLVAIIFFRRYSPFIRWVLIAALVYIVWLVFESSIVYSSYFKYPHVFSKILLFFPVFFMYLFPIKYEEKRFKWVAILIGIVFILDILIYNSEVLSISAFLETKRGVDASSAYLLVIPLLFFFNKYFEKNSLFYLCCFFVIAGFIVFLQHRSVWIAGGIGLLVNFLMMKKAPFKRQFQSYVSLIVIPLLVGFIAFSLIFSHDPEFVNKLSDRANDIVNYKTEGTGSWRYQQFQSYWPYIADHFLFGMHFKGFELPIQFYHPEAGVPFFNDGTGHHFHSLYLDKLFYLGLVGLLITLAPVFYILYKVFTRKTLSVVQMTLSAFAISSVFYGLSYWWPTFVYGFLGLALALLDKEEEEETEDQEENMLTTKTNLTHLKKEYV